MSHAIRKPGRETCSPEGRLSGKTTHSKVLVWLVRTESKSCGWRGEVQVPS
jgi:hypothetical protein